MPLHSKKHIKNGIVALWEINESKEELTALLPKSWLRNIDLDRVSRHNLAARVLAHTVCPEFDILEKDEYGKPYFESASRKISLTHAGDFAGFMYKEHEDCGIDMEKISSRIRKIGPRFIREDEQDFQKAGLEGMYLVWCAKEALYKYYGLKGLDFRDHMKLEFNALGESGELIGNISKGEYQQQVKINYQFFEEYLIVYTN